MRRIIPLILAATTGLGGVAVADEHHHDNRGERHERAEHHAYNNHAYNNRGYYGNAGYRNSRAYYGGRHYYDYYHRPSVIVENFTPRPGYVWIRGQWSWTGYEWIWQPGHFVASGYYRY